VTRQRPILAIAAALTLLLGGAAGLWLTSTAAHAATTTLCQEQTAPVAGGTYTVQNNEYDSSASECVTTDGNADFTVANSSISNATDGSPGAYPSIYQGCHWGNCSSGGLTSTPIEVSNLTSGKVTTSWSTTQPGGSSDYDVAYDIWFNKTPTTSGQPDCTELMVWLNHNGPVQPFGSQVASNVSLGGHTYNIWEGAQSSWDTVTYDMTSGATSVSGLDIGTLAQDMVSRGYTSSSCYLIDVEAGFELWQGGAGLATSSFSVSINGSTPTPTPTPTPTSTPTPTPTPTPSPTTTSSGPASCSAAYSLTNSWPGGFQGQVVVTSTGSGTLNGWTLSWTFPGDQKINDLWNGSYAQSGESVTVTSLSYDATLAPGATATVGFTGTFTSSDTSPSSVSCT
jgi:Glycosyl hydrolase family 12/Cellulose binding domain